MTKMQKLELLVLEQAQAYHVLAGIIDPKHRHCSISFTTCNEETCSILRKQLDNLEVHYEEDVDFKSTTK